MSDMNHAFRSIDEYCEAHRRSKGAKALSAPPVAMSDMNHAFRRIKGCYCPDCEARRRSETAEALSALSVRCTTAERDAMADLLSRHCEAGSLDVDEFQSRLDKAMAAVYHKDLALLTLDLPVLPAPQPVPSFPQAREDRSFRTWTPAQWAAQNSSALLTTITAFGIGATHPHNYIFLVALLYCCSMNALLGFRKSVGLGVFGFLTGPLAWGGTLLMILLTFRCKPKGDVKCLSLLMQI